MWTEDLVKRLMRNPVYVVEIDESLFGSHEPMITRDQWVEIAKKDIEQNGLDDFLYGLLEALENPVLSGDPDKIWLGDAETMTPPDGTNR